MSFRGRTFFCAVICRPPGLDGFDCAGHPGEADVGNFVLQAVAARKLTIPYASCHVTPRHAMPRHATLRHATPRYATPRYATTRNVTQRHATPPLATLTVMLRHSPQFRTSASYAMSHLPIRTSRQSLFVLLFSDDAILELHGRCNPQVELLKIWASERHLRST